MFYMVLSGLLPDIILNAYLAFIEFCNELWCSYLYLFEVENILITNPKNKSGNKNSKSCKLRVTGKIVMFYLV